MTWREILRFVAWMALIGFIFVAVTVWMYDIVLHGFGGA